MLDSHSSAERPLVSRGQRVSQYNAMGPPTRTYDATAPPTWTQESSATSRKRGSSASAHESRFFPMEPFRHCFCCGPEVLAILPGQCRKIHCWAHLVLLLGVVTSTFMLGDTLHNWYWRGCRTHYCQGRILPLVFVVLCLFYFVRTITQYDENLLKKQKDIEQAKDQLAKRYQETVAEMDSYVAKSMDTQASLAERSFEGKRRDFQRFMQKIARDYKGVGGNSAEAQNLLKELRRFVRHWLRVFAECSIDPVGRPLVLVSNEDLDSCNNVTELAELVSQRVKAAQVRIISTQRERDQKELSGLRGNWKKKTKELSEKLALRRRSSQRKSTVKDVEVGTLKFGMGVMQQESTEAVDHRWFQPFVSKRCCAWDASNADQDGFPVEVHCLWSRIVLLSAEHIQLMLSFLIGFLVLGFEFTMVQAKEIKICLASALVVCQICIVFVLHEFIDIDIVQQLEKQLLDVQAEQEKLECRRQSMLGFYEKAQLLADVWLHRTVPRLEIMKQLSDGAEDAGTGRMLPVLTDMNAKLQDLQNSLPELSGWLNDEVMNNSDKNRVGNSLNQLTKAHDVKEVLAWMPQCTRQITEDNNKRVHWSNSVLN